MKHMLEKQVLFHGVIVRTFWMTLVSVVVSCILRYNVRKIGWGNAMKNFVDLFVTCNQQGVIKTANDIKRKFEEF